ncbi:hypothetical protein SAMN05444339_1203 [Loktanella atrilutea]|uniref:Oxaloacetate decarboxylase, gamma chain n=1 Tax=Loktanella atrilutea TaxID=366533 RepID=A0A1M5FDP8_LOKAT|nr:hypothetical protein SAMN05444339_1203 [Loktanella atrilutea]
MTDMMNGPMTGMLMAGCGIAILLVGAVLVLSVMALIKYLRRPA